MPGFNPKEPPFCPIPRAKMRAVTRHPDQGFDLEPFRETFLAHILEPPDNETMRAFGDLHYTQTLANSSYWPHSYMDATAQGLQAALADLRYLQGFLASRCTRTETDRQGDRDQFEGDEEIVKKHDALCELGNRINREIGLLADELEKEVGDWQYE